MPLLSHSLPSVEGTLPQNTRSRTGVRRSLLDRLDHPRAVFALLGTAALIGLTLAFVVLRGLQHLGQPGAAGDDVAGAAATKGEPRPARPKLTAELQYEVMSGNGSSSSARADAASNAAGNPG